MKIQQIDSRKFYALAFALCLMVLAGCSDDRSIVFNVPAESSSSDGEVAYSGAEISSSSEEVLSSISLEYGMITDARDGRSYATVVIGEQTWMAQNLNYDYNAGTLKSFCYENDTAYCAVYGRLYTWSAAMDAKAKFSTTGQGCGSGAMCTVSGNVRGACPEGWHLPSRNEFLALHNYVGGVDVAGKVLKATFGWESEGNGSDSFGFSALPAGRYYNGFIEIGLYGHFWSSTEYDESTARAQGLDYSAPDVNLGNYSKNDALSVRCLKD